MKDTPDVRLGNPRAFSRFAAATNWPDFEATLRERSVRRFPVGTMARPVAAGGGFATNGVTRCSSVLPRPPESA